MSAFVLLLLCPVLGILACRRSWLPESTPAVINAWLLKIALPALVLEQIPRLHFDPTLWFTALAPWVLMLGSAVLMPLLGRRYGWSRPAVGSLVLTVGLANTSFVGFPMIVALRGSQALGPAVIADQLGSFLALSTVGVPLAAWYAGHEAQPRELLRRVLFFPPMVALIAAFLVLAVGGWPDWIGEVLHRLGETLTPLALFLIGFQFRPSAVADYRGPIACAMVYKLVLGPLAVWLASLVLGLHSLPVTVGILQVAMGPMVAAGVLAQEHGLEPRLANAVVSVGIALSFVTVPLWHLLLG